MCLGFPARGQAVDSGKLDVSCRDDERETEPWPYKREIRLVASSLSLDCLRFRDLLISECPRNKNEMKTLSSQYVLVSCILAHASCQHFFFQMS